MKVNERVVGETGGGDRQSVSQTKTERQRNRHRETGRGKDIEKSAWMHTYTNIYIRTYLFQIHTYVSK